MGHSVFQVTSITDLLARVRHAYVMEYLCKQCGKRKGNGQGWLLAFELAKPFAESPLFPTNTIVLMGEWDETRARECKAVHFCSQDCQEEYVARWYSRERVAA